MKNYSISIEHKDEAIRLFEKLGYKEDIWWNEVAKHFQNTHILAYNNGTWGFFNHNGNGRYSIITIEELRELVNQTLTPQNTHKA